MSLSVGELVAHLELDITELQKGSQAAQREFEKVEKAGTSAGKAIGDETAKGSEKASKASQKSAREQEQAAKKTARESAAAAKKAAKEQEQAAKKAAKEQEQAAQKAQQAWNTTGTALLAVGTAITGVGVAALKTGIEYNTLQQTTRAALKTITGSAEAANAQMDKLDEFARSSPFAKQVFIQAQQQLLGFGMEAEKVIPTLDAVQDAVAAVGGSNEQISEITNTLAKIQGTGKITALTLNELGMRGIDAATIIGERMGQTGEQIRDSITKGSLSGAEALQALTEGMKDRFGGAAANVKETFTGAVDRVKGAWRDLSAELAEPLVSQQGGGMLVDLANSAADAMRWFQKLPEPIKKSTTAISGIAGAGTLAAGTFILLGPRVMQTVTSFKAMGPAAQGAVKGLQAVTGASRENIGVLSKVAGAAALAKAAQMGVNWAVIEWTGNTVKEGREAALALEKINETGQVTQDDFAALGATSLDLGEAMRQTFDPGLYDRVMGPMQSFVDGFTGGLMGNIDQTEQLTRALESADAGLTVLASQNKMGVAEQQFRMWADTLKAGGATVDQIKERFPEFVAVIESGGGDVEQVLKGVEDAFGGVVDEANNVNPESVNNAFRLMRLEGEELEGALENIKNAWDRLGSVFDDERAHLNYLSSLRDMNELLPNLEEKVKATKAALDEAKDGKREAAKAAHEAAVADLEGAKSLDIQTQAGRDAAMQLMSTGDAAAAQALQVKQLTGSHVAGIYALEKNKKELIKNAVAAGYNKEAAKELFNQLQIMDGTTVTAEMVVRAGDAQKKIDEIDAELRKLQKIPVKDRTTEIEADISKFQKQRAEAQEEIDALNKEIAEPTIDANNEPGLTAITEFETRFNELRKMSNITKQIDVSYKLPTTIPKPYNPSFAGHAHGGPIGGLASGGRVPGTPPATPWVDNVLALGPGGLFGLRSGEYVMNEPATRANEGLFAALNANPFLLKNIQGLAKGGKVGTGGVPSTAEVRLMDDQHRRKWGNKQRKFDKALDKAKTSGEKKTARRKLDNFFLQRYEADEKWEAKKRRWDDKRRKLEEQAAKDEAKSLEHRNKQKAAAKEARKVEKARKSSLKDVFKDTFGKGLFGGSFGVQLTGMTPEQVESAFQSIYDKAAPNLSKKQRADVADYLKKKNKQIQKQLAEQARLAEEAARIEGLLTQVDATHQKMRGGGVAAAAQEYANAETLTTWIQERMRTVQKFGENLGRLHKIGMPVWFLQELFDAGLEGAAAAENLLNDPNANWDHIRTMLNSLDDVTKSFAQTGVGIAYNDGKAVTEGLLKGITSQQAKVDAAIEELGGQIQKSIKKKFGIASPAKLTQPAGGFLTEGVGVGMFDAVPKLDPYIARVGAHINNQYGSMRPPIVAGSLDALPANQIRSRVDGAMSPGGQTDLVADIHITMVTPDGQILAEQVEKGQRIRARFGAKQVGL